MSPEGYNEIEGEERRGAEQERFARERERLLERERAARAEAEAARRRLDEVLRSIEDGFSALDRGWRYTYANDRAVKLSGRSRGELLGTSVWEVFPELSESYARMRRAAERGETVQLELFCPRLGGWLQHRVFPQSGGGTTVYTRDVSEQVRAREELRPLETRFRTVVDRFPLATYVFAPDGRSLRSNEAWREIWDLEDDGDREPANVFEDERVRAAGLMPLVEQGVSGSPASTDEPLLYDPARIGADGDPKWLKAFVYPLRTGDGDDDTVSEVMLVVEDVTGRERAEEAIRESEEKYRMLFGSMDEGFYLAEVLFDEDDRPVDVHYLESNPAANRMVGADYAGRWLAEIDPDHEPNWVETFGRVARTGESERLEMYAGPLETWFGFNVFKVGAEDGRRIAVLFEDVTERKHREANAAFLAGIRDDFTRLASADEIMQAVGAKIGAYMDLATCNFIDIDESRGKLTVSYFWGRTEVPSLLGTFRIEDFLNEEWRRASRAGETTVVRDTRTDPRTNARSYAALEIGAFVGVPFDRGGEWQHFLAVSDSRPRDWREDEIELFRELSNRIFPRLERARAEEALRESEARLRAVADVVPDLLWSNDAHGGADWYNRRWSEYTGQTPEEARGYGWLDAIHPDDRKTTLRSFQRMVDSGEPMRQEHRIRNAAGNYRWFLVQARPLKDEDGEILRWYGAATDVHEERAALEALRASEERYRSLVTASASIVWRGSGVGEIIEANPSWEAYTGQPREEYSGMGWLDAVHPEDRSRVVAVWEAAIREKESMAVEFRLRRAGREDPYHRVVARGVPILNEDGDEAVREWIGTITDVEDERRAGEVLRETELRMMALFHSDVIGIASGEENHILEANEVLLDSLGYDREDLLDGGLDYVEMTPPEERERVFEALEESKQTGSFGPLEKHFVGKDGRLVPTILGGYCLSAEPFRYTKFVLDVSEQKRAEEALRESEERLRTLVEGAPVILFALDREGKYTLAVGRGLDVLGFGQNELVGRNVFEMYADDPTLLGDVRRALSGEAFTVERALDGSVFEIRFNPALGAGGEVTSVVGVATDVTGRKEAERERDRLLARQWRARAEAEERRRISRELHDRAAHSMGVVHQSLELFEALKERDQKAAEARMKIARENAKESLDATRNLSRELRGLEIKEPLSLALSDAVRTTVPPGLESDVRLSGNESLIPPYVREQLFLILREGVRNTVAHSGASRLRVEVDVTPQGVVGSVVDDGQGFDGALPEGASSGGDDDARANGLHSMKERAELVGGRFEVRSVPGEGTGITVYIPLDGIDYADGRTSGEGEMA